MTNFEKMTSSPEALAEAMVSETAKGIWRYGIGEKMSVQAFRSREAAERGAVEYLKHRYEQGWLDWLNKPAESVKPINDYKEVRVQERRESLTGTVTVVVKPLYDYD